MSELPEGVRIIVKSYLTCDEGFIMEIDEVFTSINPEILNNAVDRIIKEPFTEFLDHSGLRFMTNQEIESYLDDDDDDDSYEDDDDSYEDDHDCCGQGCCDHEEKLAN